MESRGVERLGQLKQDSRQVALAAELVPELRGGGLDGSNHLAQRCAQRIYALLEASPRSLQATFFLLCGRRFWRLAGVGLGVVGGATTVVSRSVN